MALKSFSIGPHKIGSNRTFLIAEVAQAHDGSLGAAHAFIDAAASSGADAIKFQTHIADAESTYDEEFRTKFSWQDATRYDYWHRMEFSKEQWAGLVSHASTKGLVFLSSVFSVEAVDLLEALGTPAWKVGSGEIATEDIFDRIAKTGKPLLISTGMSLCEEIRQTYDKCRTRGCDLALFQCTTRYPTPLSEVGLNVMIEMKEMFDCPVGLSDHSGRTEPSIAAIAFGAHLLELHVTFDRGCFGPDTPASVSLDDFKRVAAFRDCFLEMVENPVDKDVLAERMVTTRKLFGKSLALRTDMPAGTVLSREMLTLKKPGTGIPAEAITSVIGRRLLEDVSCRRLLRWEQINMSNDRSEAKL